MKLKRLFKDMTAIQEAQGIVMSLILIVVIGAIGIFVADQTLTQTNIATDIDASTTLTFTNNFADNDNVTIGTIKYELNSAGAVTAGHVNVSTSGNLTRDYVTDALRDAINAHATTSTLVIATAPTNSTVTITTLANGFAGNDAVTVSENIANATWSSSTTTGGVTHLSEMQDDVLGAADTGTGFIVILIIAFIGAIAIGYMFTMMRKV